MLMNFPIAHFRRLRCWVLDLPPPPLGMLHIAHDEIVSPKYL